MDAVGTLDKDGTSHSRLTLTMRGDGERVIRSALRQVAPAQYGQLTQSISQSMGYAGTTSNPELSRPEDTNEPVKLSYDYKREKGGDWANYRIVPQVAPVTLPRFDDSDPLVRTLDLGYPRIHRDRAPMMGQTCWKATRHFLFVAGLARGRVH